MKKLNLLLLSALAIFSFSSCSKDDDKPADQSYTCTTCTTTPEAIAANDASSKGIYKGIVLGSSGTIKFNIANNGTDITAVMVIDGVTVNLTSSITWMAGQAYVADFTGTLNGSPVTIGFSVALDGADPVVTTSDIPGHPSATLSIVKETSNNLVEVFEGTYSTTLPETGTFNIIMGRSVGLWGGIARITGGTSADDDDIDGTVTNNEVFANGSSGSQRIGTLNIDKLTGSFVDGNGSTVTIDGKRTL